MSHDCPMCGLEFEGADCHSSCPFAAGCAMIRCPRCAYEYVEDGRLVSLVRRIAARASAAPHPAPADHEGTPLSRLWKSITRTAAPKEPRPPAPEGTSR